MMPGLQKLLEQQSNLRYDRLKQIKNDIEYGRCRFLYNKEAEPAG